MTGRSHEPTIQPKEKPYDALIALGSRVIVRPDETEESSRGGVFMPQTARDRQKPQEGMVLAVGPGRILDNGALARVASNITPGTRVLHTRYGGTEVNIDGEIVLILEERDCLVIVNAPKANANKADFVHRAPDRTPGLGDFLKEGASEPTTERKSFPCLVKPLATIVVPTYNRPEDLTACLASLRLGYGGVDIVVVNDGGCNVDAIAFKYNAAHWYQDNAGSAAACNKGLALVDTPYVGFLADDDRLYPNHVHTLADMLAELEECEGAIVHAAHSFFRIRYERQSEPGSEYAWENYAYNDTTFAHPYNPQTLPYGGNIATCAMLFRTRMLQELGGWDPTIGAFCDLELLMRVGAKTPIMTVPVYTGEVVQRTGGDHYGMREGTGRRGVECLQRIWRKHPSDDPLVQGGRAHLEMTVAARQPSDPYVFPPTRYLPGYESLAAAR